MYQDKILKVKFGFRGGLSAGEMRAVDEGAVRMGLQIRQMMEVAGFQMARLIQLNEENLDGKRVLVVAGKGNNGGDAIACSRFLANWGAEILLVTPPDVNEHGQHHLKLLKRMGISYINDIDVFCQPNVIVDGIIGYSIRDPMRSPYVKWIEHINSLKAKVYSYDLPSGLNPDDGSVHGVAVKADYTLTLAYPKKGLFIGQSKKHVGNLYLADIGIPEVVYEEVRGKVSKIKHRKIFSGSSIVKLN